MTGKVNRLLNDLPAFKGEAHLIKKKQSVTDIVKEISAAHKVFAPDYDRIVKHFTGAKNVYRELFHFVQDNVKYEIEPVKLQTTMAPSAILAIGKGDCKHYSSFIAGVLDALNRAGYGNHDWHYRFAGYGSEGIEHVFVVVNDGGEEIWIDAAPLQTVFGTYRKRSFNDRLSIPQVFFDKKTDTMSLERISGISTTGFNTITIAKRETPEPTKRPGDCGCGCAEVGATPADTSDKGGVWNMVVSYVKANPVEAAAIGSLTVWGLYELFRKKKKGR